VIEHDRLFKSILTHFFSEFTELFLPDIAQYIDSAAPHPVDKELFARGGKGLSVADVVMKARFKAEHSSFLVHVEAQAKRQSHFGLRLLKYYVLLRERYRLPVYPVAIFSFDQPQKQQRQALREGMRGRKILDFEYTVIQLNQMDWRAYAGQSNPVAAAFMAKMKMAQRDKVSVKLECLNMLEGLNLAPENKAIVSEFIDSYLALSEKEEQQYEAELEKLNPEKREGIMQVRMSWKDQGIKIGRELGQAEGRAEGEAKGRKAGALSIVRNLLTKRLGPLQASTLNALQELSAEQLEALSLTGLEFDTVADLESVLSLN